MNWDYCLSHAPWPEAMLIVYGYRQQKCRIDGHPFVFLARDFPRNLSCVERSRFVQKLKKKKKKTSNKIQIKIQQSIFLMETEISTESLLLLAPIVAKSVS